MCPNLFRLVANALSLLITILLCVISCHHDIMVVFTVLGRINEIRVSKACGKLCPEDELKIRLNMFYR